MNSVVCQSCKSGPLKVIGQFSHNGIGLRLLGMLAVIGFDPSIVSQILSWSVRG